MSLLNIFDVVGSGMSAQSVRLNTIASNLANANNKATTPAEVYKPRQPVFSSMLQAAQDEHAAVGVQVLGIVETQQEPIRTYDPNNPLANAQGYVYSPNINAVEEMANMMAASRAFQNNIEALNTSKRLILATIELGK